VRVGQALLTRPGYTEYPAQLVTYGSNPLAAWTTAAAATDDALGWLSAANSFAYSNPYYVAPATTVVQPVYNYAEPIPVQALDQPLDAALGATEPAAQIAPADIDAVPTVAGPPTAAAPDAVQAPTRKRKRRWTLSPAGRDSFKAGQYARAQAEVKRRSDRPPPTRSCTSSAP